MRDRVWDHVSRSVRKTHYNNAIRRVLGASSRPALQPMPSCVGPRSKSPRSPSIKVNTTMADNSNDPVMRNHDVVQGARGIRRNPAQLAALMARALGLRAGFISPQGSGRACSAQV